MCERALANANQVEAGCLISTYSVASHGYAQIGWWEGGRSRMTTAHRAAWTAVYGAIPEGMTVDHLCKVRRCINPEHLRLLSNVENARRNQGADYPIGLACRKGHPSSARVRVARRTKAGERRWGFTCGMCVQEARQRWIDKKAVA